MLKFIHLISGTTFLGIIIANFFYVTRGIRKRDRSLIDYALRASFFGDGVILFLLLIQLNTAARLVSAGNFTLAVPWIFIAYIVFGTIIVLWLAMLSIKLLFFYKTDISPTGLKFFYSLNVITVLLFMIIIHDAVTQNTWFDFLFG